MSDPKDVKPAIDHKMEEEDVVCGFSVWRLDYKELAHKSQVNNPEPIEGLRLNIADALANLEDLERRANGIRKRLHVLRNNCDHSWSEPPMRYEHGILSAQGCCNCGEVRRWNSVGKELEPDPEYRPPYNSTFPPSSIVHEYWSGKLQMGKGQR